MSGGYLDPETQVDRRATGRQPQRGAVHFPVLPVNVHYGSRVTASIWRPRPSATGSEMLGKLSVASRNEAIALGRAAGLSRPR